MIFTDNVSYHDHKWWIEQVEKIANSCMCDCEYCMTETPQCSLIFGPLCGAWDDLKESLETKQRC